MLQLYVPGDVILFFVQIGQILMCNVILHDFMHDFVRTSMISSCFQLFLETLCLPTPITTGQFLKTLPRTLSRLLLNDLTTHDLLVY